LDEGGVEGFISHGSAKGVCSVCFDAWLPFRRLLHGEDGVSGVRVDVESVHDVVKGGGGFLVAYFEGTADVGGEGVVAWEGGRQRAVQRQIWLIARYMGRIPV
jgi:hypothetical protein